MYCLEKQDSFVHLKRRRLYAKN
uniref:Uncharacterized protein n=1 Tax=Arundo donax TaxID=35708 RepID=A0A0A9C6G8_ARUDO